MIKNIFWVSPNKQVIENNLALEYQENLLMWLNYVIFRIFVILLTYRSLNYVTNIYQICDIIKSIDKCKALKRR